MDNPGVLLIRVLLSSYASAEPQVAWTVRLREVGKAGRPDKAQERVGPFTNTPLDASALRFTAPSTMVMLLYDSA